MRLFVGRDVSLEKTAIGVVGKHGTIEREAQAASEPETPRRCMGELDRTIAAIGLEEDRAMGRPDALAQPVGRARCLRRDPRGGRRQPSTRPVPGCDGHDAPWPFDLAENMGRAGCPPPWHEARDGRPGKAHRADPSPDAG